jgi:hypothetical protein
LSCPKTAVKQYLLKTVVPSLVESSVQPTTSEKVERHDGRWWLQYEHLRAFSFACGSAARLLPGNEAEQHLLDAGGCSSVFVVDAHWTKVVVAPLVVVVDAAIMLPPRASNPILLLVLVLLSGVADS